MSDEQLISDRNKLKAEIKILIQCFNEKHPAFKVGVECIYTEFESETGKKSTTGFDVKLVCFGLIMRTFV